MFLFRDGLFTLMYNAYSEYGVQVYFKGGNTIKNFLMAPKDQDAIQKKVESFTGTNVTGVECDEEYIGESSRTFWRGSKNISRHLPPFMTTISPLVTMLP